MGKRLGEIRETRPMPTLTRPQRSYPAGYDPADIEAVFGG